MNIKIMNIFKRSYAPIFLVFSIIGLGGSGYHFYLSNQPSISVNTIAELNDNLGNKVELTVSEISSTGVGVRITGNSSTKYFFYTAKFDSNTIIIVSGNDKGFKPNSTIIGYVENIKSTIGKDGQAFDYFRRRYSQSIYNYNNYALDVYNPASLIVVFSIVGSICLVCTLICFTRKEN